MNSIDIFVGLSQDSVPYRRSEQSRIREQAIQELNNRLLQNQASTPAEEQFFATNRFVEAGQPLGVLEDQIGRIEKEWKDRLNKWEKFVSSHINRPSFVNSDYSSTPESSHILKERVEKIQRMALDVLIADQSNYKTNRPKVQALFQRSMQLIQEMTRAEQTYEKPEWVTGECTRLHREQEEAERIQEERSSCSYQVKQQAGRFVNACKAEAGATLNLVRHPTQIPAAMRRHPVRTAVLGVAAAGCASPLISVDAVLTNLCWGVIVSGVTKIYRTFRS